MLVRCPAVIASLLLLLLLAPCATEEASADERFLLEVPNQPRQRATAVLSGRELTVVDSEGQRHVYSRRPELDSADRDFAAFYSETARRYLRWPVAGSGRMFLGTLRGDTVVWSPSRMEIQRVGADNPAVRPPGGIVRPPQGVDGGEVLGDGGPIAAWATPDGGVSIARVDRRGRIEGFDVVGEDWRPWRDDEQAVLPPAAAIALGSSPSGSSPTIYAFTARGDLSYRQGEGRWRTVPAPRGAEFLGGQRLSAFDDGNRTTILAVDQQGRLWGVEPETRDWMTLEDRDQLLPSGAAISVVNDTEPRALVVDRRGHLLEYRIETRGNRVPRRVASRLTPGSEVAVWSGRDPRNGTLEHRVAAVDNSGRLGIWTADRASWHQEVYRDITLPPGAPLALGRRGGEWMLSAIQADGRWGAWTLGDRGWVADPILDGFVGGAPVVSVAGGAVWCAVDRAGRIVAARRLQNRWNSVLLARQYAFAPRLVQRQIVAERSLPPADVVFVNRHSEELVVRLFDHSRGDAPRELVIAPGKSTRVKLDRDPGAMLTEVFLMPSPGGGFHEEVREVRLPPSSRYTANVWVNRVTSVYFDRTTNKGPDPDEVNQSLVSLGVFPLPPGDQLDDGQRVDVYREATARRNPGAVRQLEPDPQP